MVALAAATYAGQVLAILCVVGTVCGLPTAIGGLPGGMATALIVQERARSLGMNQVVMLSVLLLTTQALIGCPVAAACIRREARRLDSLPAPAASAAADAAEAKLRKAQFGSLLRLYAVAWAATRLEQLTGLSRYVLCLLLGLALAAVGWLDRAELASSKSDGFFFFLLIGSVLSGFAAAEPAMFGQMLPVLLLVLAVSALSAMAISQLLGRLLGFSGAMAMALSMNVMVGFPMNMLISQEIIEHLTADPEKRQYLMEEIAARMVLGGMVTTTFLATAAAGLLVPLMG